MTKKTFDYALLVRVDNSYLPTDIFQIPWRIIKKNKKKNNRFYLNKKLIEKYHLKKFHIYAHPRFSEYD